jgi:hypothetical protein
MITVNQKVNSNLTIFDKIDKQMNLRKKRKSLNSGSSGSSFFETEQIN